MDRRTFMMTGAGLSSVTGGAWPWLASAAAQGGTLAIVDSTLACGPSFARYAARMNLPLFDSGEDIGALWYTTLAPLLEQKPMGARRGLIGVTRACDYFVLKELAIRSAHLAEPRHAQRGAAAALHAHVAFAFTPRSTRRSGH
ncbi:hypothetical protein CIC12_27240 [Burkholderia sp. SG-MS1]|uniref:hypothetical protein n=1 Tax=Paraburkholderia sp. SG-MS1 TaxID=2023741 RepID=UPI001447E0C4|nr:hypothetical protein [Paraburkholderia sp. SG-MS1]NKJ50351.1 hypothetical protein [Paraburkholderia sp. SG-MS1]